MTAKYSSKRVDAGCELENFALSAALAALRKEGVTVEDLAVTTDCDHACARTQECPVLDPHHEQPKDPCALTKAEFTGRCKLLQSILVTLVLLVLPGCAAFTPSPFTPWDVVVESTATTPLTIEERGDMMRFGFTQQRCLAGVAVSTAETVTMQKGMLCKPRRGWLGKVLNGVGEFVGAVMSGIFL
jgi:hypothetical protein